MGRDPGEGGRASKSKLGLGIHAGYGVGAVGTGIYATVPGLLLLFFMTDTLGIPAWLAGVGIFVPKLWDVLTDPLMGTISDRTQSRWGRRRPYLLAGALSLPLSFVMLFSLPAFADPMLSFAWVMFAYLLAATSFTVFSVPYTAMPAEMSEDYDEVTSLMGWRIALLTVGVLLSGALAPQLVALGGGGRSGYASMSWALAGMIFAAMFLTFVGTRRAPSRPRLEQDAQPLLEQIRGALAVRPFRVLLGGYAMQLVGVGVVLACVPYFARYTLGGDDDTLTFMFVTLVGPAVLVMPVWVRVSRAIGKRRALLASTTLFACGAACLWFARPEGLAVVYACVALMGIGWAGTQLFPFSMLPDTIAADRQQSGQRREGVFTGLWMAVDKGGLAVGALLAGLVLDFGGFVESEGQAVVNQPSSALTAIRIGAALLPAICMFISLPILRRYALDRAAVRELQQEAT
ncbi:MFS transporter [Pseudenhygromyxa sp. WMMC2535]|uniref:MFS transporter n=1 Tax=Pseudenhygromyxa sp. WMMC2535 TaxID=2712867 RepID=UPI0015563E69|nr:MFS transporter [Pseudenhygromyxa sp. WMMC2535]NVB38715.1 MFS transporter [Pseudenhygromyxa sp. WMMC2535]